MNVLIFLICSLTCADWPFISYLLLIHRFQSCILNLDYFLHATIKVFSIATQYACQSAKRPCTILGNECPIIYLSIPNHETFRWLIFYNHVSLLTDPLVEFESTPVGLLWDGSRGGFTCTPFIPSLAELVFLGYSRRLSCDWPVHVSDPFFLEGCLFLIDLQKVLISFR